MKEKSQSPTPKKPGLCRVGSDVSGNGGRKGGDLVAVFVNEPDSDLEPCQAVVVSKINGFLRMLKIESIVNICRPVA